MFEGTIIRWLYQSFKSNGNFLKLLSLAAPEIEELEKCRAPSGNPSASTNSDRKGRPGWHGSLVAHGKDPSVHEMNVSGINCLSNEQIHG
jgi:hypothetical protein